MLTARSCVRRTNSGRLRVTTQLLMKSDGPFVAHRHQSGSRSRTHVCAVFICGKTGVRIGKSAGCTEESQHSTSAAGNVPAT